MSTLPSATTPDGRPVAYPPEAVLTVEDVRVWLQKPNAKAVLRLPIKRSGRRNVRFLAEWVYDYLRAEAA